MNIQSMQCPGCGQQTAIRYCSRCGEAISSTCSSCGAKVEPGMHKCDECGASHTVREAPREWNAQTIVPWVALVFAGVALVIAAISMLDRETSRAAPVQFQVPETSTIPMPDQTTDISRMLPREAANQLFNRVMAASENGDTGQVAQFAPMALLAYEGLGTLDNDSRYHVALLHMAAGDYDSAQISLDKLRQSVPDHLLGFMLADRIADQNGNQAASNQAKKAFLAAYDAEIATGRIEYQDHRGSIERFRKAAQVHLTE